MKRDIIFLLPKLPLYLSSFTNFDFRERIDESKEAFLKMIKNENTRGVPLLVAANKQGREGYLVLLGVCMFVHAKGSHKLPCKAGCIQFYHGR